MTSHKLGRRPAFRHVELTLQGRIVLVTCPRTREEAERGMTTNHSPPRRHHRRHNDLLHDLVATAHEATTISSTENAPERPPPRHRAVVVGVASNDVECRFYRRRHDDSVLLRDPAQHKFQSTLVEIVSCLILYDLIDAVEQWVAAPNSFGIS